MPLQFKDRVKDQTNTTGTGTLTIDGVAPTGYRTITSAHTTGMTVRYTVINGSGSQWEVGEGLWTSAGSTLTRATVYASSNNGALVNFSSGAKAVFTGPVAADRNGVIDTNLAFTGTGLRITGDFTNNTISSRLLFQTSTANSLSNVGVIPNGTATNAQFAAYNSSDPNNSSIVSLVAASATVRLISGNIGTGTLLPIAFVLSATEAARFATSGNLLLGTTTDNGTDRLQVSGSMSLFGALRVGGGLSAGTAGQVLTSSGTGLAPTWSAVAASSLQEFTSSGTWTKPSNANFVMVEAWGGGGGGGGGQRQIDTVLAGGSGGGGGAYAYRLFKASDLPATVTVAVAAGGSGGAAAASNSSSGNFGSSGGTSSFGDFLYAYGGSGGNRATSTAFQVAGVKGAGVLANSTPSQVDGDGAFGNAVQAASSYDGRHSGFGGGNGGGSYAADTASFLFVGNGGDSYQGGGGGGSGGGRNSGSVDAGGGNGGGSGANVVITSTGGYGGENGLAGAAGAFRQGGGGGSPQNSAKSTHSVVRAVFGGSRIVARDSNNSQWAITSTDNGATWTFLPLPSDGSSELFYVGTEWFLIPQLPARRILKSSDLTTWTTVGFTPGSFGNTISYANGVWFSGGPIGLLLSSTDLITWTTRSTGVSTTHYGVVWTGTNYVVAADSGGVRYSTNLTSWSGAVGVVGSAIHIANNGATVVVWANTINGLYSSNHGQTFAIGNNAANPTSSSVQCLAYLNNTFVLLAASAVYTSANGVSWTALTDGTTDNYAGMVYTGSAYYIGSNTANSTAGITSPDLTTWTSRSITSRAATGGAAGGAGGLGGGGGGGGASALNGLGAGAGGAGGNGLVRVYTW